MVWALLTALIVGWLIYAIIDDSDGDWTAYALSAVILFAVFAGFYE